MKRAITAAMGLLFGASAPAQEAVSDSNFRFQITPFAGYRVGGQFADEFTDSKLDVDAGGSVGLILNMRDSANTEWEIAYSHQDTSIDTTGVSGIGDLDLSIDYLQFGGTYIGPSRLARPFLAATVGLSRFDPEASQFSAETYLAFSIGAGVKLWPENRFGLRLEGRLYGSVLDSDSKIFCVSGAANSGCLISTKAEVLWQWEMMLGAILRF